MVISYSILHNRSTLTHYYFYPSEMNYYIFQDKTYEENAKMITEYMEKRKKNTFRKYVSEEIKNIAYELKHDVFTRDNIYQFAINSNTKILSLDNLFDNNHKYLSIYSAYLMLSSPNEKSYSYRQFEFHTMCVNILNMNSQYITLSDDKIMEFIVACPDPTRDAELTCAFHNNRIIGPAIIEQFMEDNLALIKESLRYNTFVREIKMNSRLITQLARLYLKNY